MMGSPASDSYLDLEQHANLIVQNLFIYWRGLVIAMMCATILVVDSDQMVAILIMVDSTSCLEMAQCEAEFFFVVE